MVETLTPASREEWLTICRPGTTGASSSPALLGVHPWMTRRKLWSIETGLIAPDEETRQMKRGRFIEGPAIALVAEERPDWTVAPNPIPGGKFYRDKKLKLSATPDAFVTIPDRDGFGVLQMKSVQEYVFKKDWQEQGALVLPTYVGVQAIQEAMLTGASYAFAGIVVVSHGIDLYVEEIPLIPALFERIIDEAASFWHSVETGEPPEWNFEKDGALIAKAFHPLDDAPPVDLSGKNDLPELVAEDAILRVRMKADKGRREQIKNRFLAEMGQSTVALYNGVVIATAKIITRKEHFVKESQYPQVRLKGEE